MEAVPSVCPRGTGVSVSDEGLAGAMLGLSIHMGLDHGIYCLCRFCLVPMVGASVGGGRFVRATYLPTSLVSGMRLGAEPLN